MTPRQYIAKVERLASSKSYAELLELVDAWGPRVDDQLTAEDVRVLRILVKHAELVLTSTTSDVATARRD